MWQFKSQVLEGLPERDPMDFVTVEANGVVARGSWLEGEGDEMEEESTGAMDDDGDDGHEDDESIEVRERKKALFIIRFIRVDAFFRRDWRCCPLLSQRCEIQSS